MSDGMQVNNDATTLDQPPTSPPPETSREETRPPDSNLTAGEESFRGEFRQEEQMARYRVESAANNYASSTATAPGKPGTGGFVWFERPIPIDPAWRNTSLAPAISGNPPTVDLSRVTPSMITGLSDQKQRDLFNWLSRAEGKAVVAFAGGGGATYPNLADALGVHVWNQSQSPEMLVKLFNNHPNPLGLAPYMRNVFSERTLTGVRDLMMRDCTLDAREAQNLVRLIDGHLMYEGDGSAPGLRSVVGSYIENYTKDGMTDGEFQSLVTFLRQRPQIKNGDSIGRLAGAAIRSGNFLTQTEADTLGDLVAESFGRLDPRNTQAAQREMVDMLNSIGQSFGRPLSPREAGFVTGIIGAGMLKQIRSFNQNQEEQKRWANLFIGALGGGGSAGAGLVNAAKHPYIAAASVALALLTPVLQEAVNEHFSPASDSSVYQWIGAVRSEWSHHYSQYGWTEQQGYNAASNLETALNMNGFPS